MREKEEGKMYDELQQQHCKLLEEREIEKLKDMKAKIE